MKESKMHAAISAASKSPWTHLREETEVAPIAEI
jgi:hypothetical protein